VFSEKCYNRSLDWLRSAFALDARLSRP